MNTPVSRFSRLRAAFAALALFAFACTDGADVAEPHVRGNAKLPISTYYAGGPVFSELAINRVRITVKVEPNGPTFGPFIHTVDPNATEWNLPVEFPLNEAVNVIVLAELINFSNGTELVEYSGRVGPFKVNPGPQNTPPPPVPVFRGGLENLDITDLRVDAPPPIIEGGSVRLTAAVQGGTNPRVFWASLDPTLATVDQTGLVRTILPGTARIVATAGPKTVTVPVNIGRRMSRIEVTPGTRTAASLGETVTFTARVLDPRNVEFTGVTINWTVADATIAEQVAPGQFRTKAKGRTGITATATGLSANAELVVDQKVAKIEVTPATATLDAVGATQAFSAVGKDANGNTIAGLAFRWSSSNSAIASVDANGVATARANGRVEISAEVDALSSKAGLEVSQKVATVEVSPSQLEFNALQQKGKFSAVAKDARGNTMTGVSFIWRSNSSSTVSVDQDGNVTSMGRGSTTVVAEAGTVAGTGRASVNQTVGKITFNVNELIFNTVGERIELLPTVRDANGFPISGSSVQFSSLTPGVVAIDVEGSRVYARAVGSGSGQVKAMSGNFSTILLADVKATNRLGGDKILLYHSDDNSYPLHLKDHIVQTGRYTAPNVHIMSMTNTPPPLADLLQYHTIIVWTDYSPPNPVAQGDRLKQYVDAGGRVILATYAYTNQQSDHWAMKGGIMQSGYSPFKLNTVSINGMRTLDMANSLMSHPIMQGITAPFTYGVNSNYTKVLMDEGATRVAVDTNGVPIVGVNHNSRVVGINIWPGFWVSWHTGRDVEEVYRIFANAARY